MECEKFEPLLLDELYEELDELTSAAVKRHVGGCARCAGIFNDLRSTRRGIALPIVPVPEGLEERILASARAVSKVVPIRSRMSRALSVAGSWAMRPQTAMAAVFLLMVGTSAFLIRSKNYRSSSTVSVTVEGAPSPVAAASGASESMDDKAAAAAHGPGAPPNVTRPPMPALAANDDETNGPLDRATGGAARDKGKADDNALASALVEGQDKDQNKKEKDALQKAAPAPSPTMQAQASNALNAGLPGGAGAGNTAREQALDPYDGYTQSAAKPSKRTGPSNAVPDPASLGAAAFRARNYAEAAKQYDLAATQTGDMNSALWAAESTKEGQGCAVALGRYVDVANKAAGSWVGNEASLRAARCQTNMGQLDAARDRLNRLAQVPSHQQAAQAQLAELNQVAAKKAGGTSAGGAVAAPRRAAAPATKAPAPAAAEEKRIEKANAY